MKRVVEFTDDNFKQEVLDCATLVLVDFWATWCSPCKAMMPVVEEVARELGGTVKIGKLNVDENPDATQRSFVMNIPTLLFFKGGREVGRMVGVNPKEKLVKEIEALA